MDVSIDIKIGALIKKVIFEKKISQAELARLLETSPTQITRLLNKNSIGTDLLCKISKILDYNFFDDFEKKEPDENLCLIKEEQIKPRGLYLTHPHIGNKITERMKKIKVSQTELGNFLGISQDVVSRILKNNSMDTSRLVKISNYLGYNFFGCFFEYTFFDEIEEASTVDEILLKYIKYENADDFFDHNVTSLISDTSIMEKYGKNIKAMTKLIKILYDENKMLKEKLKSTSK